VEKHPLTVEELDALLPAGKALHTVMETAGGTLIRAEWSRQDILAAAAANGAEMAGINSTRQGYGIAVWTKNPLNSEHLIPLFIKTTN